LKNPDAKQFESAVGLSVYSSSKPSVDSFKTFFDVLWNQMSLNEDFRKRDKLKDEFIAVASHELRTPIQPIMDMRSWRRRARSAKRRLGMQF
jgi:signal transduction histidine kinase